jgi:hypothetical protein
MMLAEQRTSKPALALRMEATRAKRTRSHAPPCPAAPPVELGQAGRDLDLNVDRPRLDAFERNGGNPLNHGNPLAGE